jgi:hypothetical protein
MYIFEHIVACFTHVGPFNYMSCSCHVIFHYLVWLIHVCLLFDLFLYVYSYLSWPVYMHVGHWYRNKNYCNKPFNYLFHLCHILHVLTWFFSLHDKSVLYFLTWYLLIHIMSIFRRASFTNACYPFAFFPYFTCFSYLVP